MKYSNKVVYSFFREQDHAEEGTGNKRISTLLLDFVRFALYHDVMINTNAVQPESLKPAPEHCAPFLFIRFLGHFILYFFLSSTKVPSWQLSMLFIIAVVYHHYAIFLCVCSYFSNIARTTSFYLLHCAICQIISPVRSCFVDVFQFIWLPIEKHLYCIWFFSQRLNSKL